MRKLRYRLGRATIIPCQDAAYLDAGEAADGEALAAAVMQTIWTDVKVTVKGTTMHLAAWADPEHWSEDWAEELGIDSDEVADAVDALLQDAVEDS